MQLFEAVIRSCYSKLLFEAVIRSCYSMFAQLLVDGLFSEIANNSLYV
jgi:hypothetical protein